MNAAQSPSRPSPSRFTVRPARPDDHDPLLALVARAGVFALDEVSCAAELIELALKDPARSGDYRLLVADPGQSGVLAGYICYGPTPMTHGTWDLYWLATAPDYQRQGIARSLCAAMESEVRGLGGYLIRVETSSTEGYGSAQSFYERSGYPMVCRVPDFYKPGDDLVLMFKRL